MKAPRKFIKNIKEGDFEEVEKWLISASMGDCDNARNIRIVNEAAGEYQGDGEYCMQSALSSETGIHGFEGIYYHQIEGCDKFIAYEYSISL